jgi:hypothetical protein
VKVHQGNDAMFRGHLKHETKSNPSGYFRFLRRGDHIQRELRSKLLRSLLGLEQQGKTQ